MKTLRGTKVKICMLILVLLIQVASPLLTIMVENSFTLTTLGAETEETTWDISANGDGSVTAVLDEEGTLTITGTGAIKDYYSWGKREWQNAKKVIIEDGITRIGSNVFYECSAIVDITIPSSVISIGDYAFYKCTGLSKLILPENLTSIGNYAFRGCSSLTSIDIPKTVASIGDYAFGFCSSIVKIEIPKGITKIAAGTFYGCTSLSSVILPNEIVNIESDAFKNCTSLTKITIPSGVASIGESAFYGCSSLTKIELPKGITKISNSVFYNCSCLTSIVIPEGVTIVDNSAFAGCKALSKITLPNTITNIGNYAFSDCKALSSVTLPEELASLGTSAFSNADGLTSIVFPYEIVSIGNSAFNYCDSLTKAVIPDNVESIGKNAFFGVSDNFKIYCRTGSAAEEYAITNKIAYEIEEEKPILRKIEKKLVAEGEQKQAVITIDAVDNGVGLSNKAYSFDGGKTWQTEATKTYIENTKDIVIKVRDLLGNEASYTTEIDMEKMSQTEILIYEIIKETDKKFLVNISPETTITKALENITTSGNIKIYKDEKEITDNNTKLATGMKLAILIESEVVDEYIIVVTGDVNGDGKTNLNDILVINKYRLGKSTLTGANLLAGDVDGNGKADLNDILKINKFRLGKIESL